MCFLHKLVNALHNYLFLVMISLIGSLMGHLLVIFFCSIGIHPFHLAHRTPRAVCSPSSRSFTTCGSTARRSALARSLALRSLVWNQISAVHAYTHTQDGREAAASNHMRIFLSQPPSKWTLDVVARPLASTFMAILFRCTAYRMT